MKVERRGNSKNCGSKNIGPFTLDPKKVGFKDQRLTFEIPNVLDFGGQCRHHYRFCFAAKDILVLVDCLYNQATISEEVRDVLRAKAGYSGAFSGILSIIHNDDQNLPRVDCTGDEDEIEEEEDSEEEDWDL